MRIAILLLVACSGSSMMPPPSEMPDAPTTTEPDAPPAPSTGCMQGQAGDSSWNLMVGTLMRTTKVHVPASYDPTKPTPLVINIHGRTVDADSQMLTSHAIAKSDAAGFIVLHPEAWGSPTSWNAGDGCCDPAYSSHIDDSGFISKLIDEAKAKLCIDENRVYVMGLSNGGYLSHRLACEHADQIAAIGPVAGVLQLQSCSPSRPMPVWIAHGTADPLVAYDWGAQSAAAWRTKNGCTTQSTTYTHGDTSCVTYGGCTGNADVVMCTVQDGGHQWPGGEALPFLGKKSDDIIATDAIWEFFVSHPRQ
jgi:polyhydroxybutyrate depolymerase